MAVATERLAGPMNTWVHSNRFAWWGLIIAVVLGAQVTNAATDSCTTARNRDGISLCQTTIDQSAFLEVTAETVLCTSSEDFQALLSDVDGYPRWIPSVLESRLLAKSANSQVYYMKYSAPWPFKPRDMVYQMTSEPSADVYHSRVTVEGLPDYIESIKAAVRLQAARGSWFFSPTAEGLSVVYTMYVDSGNAPAVIANRRLRSTVSETLVNLQKTFPCT